ncbi:MAG: 23S rRNA (guanosine(2251)-2'-O)-methyltransferase RlmB [Bacteroidales bacterium]|nr:23S rRNA (guanosine(2251)-2'-O)-methyltransferase RlmB [Bacteroidales bacterium]
MKSNTDKIFGIRACIEAIKANKEIEKVLLKKDSRGDLFYELFNLIKERAIPFQYVPIQKLNKISQKNHQGVIAFISSIEYQNIEYILPQLYEQAKLPLFLVLDKVTDVRNFGAIARTAECAGVNAIIIPAKGSALINSDAVKTSAGALHTIPVCRVENLKKTIVFLKQSGIQIVAANEKSDDYYYDVDFKIPSAIVMGAEDIGISNDIINLSDKIVKIPILGNIESLNVSVATSIIVYEAVKQRINVS